MKSDTVLPLANHPKCTNTKNVHYLNTC